VKRTRLLLVPMLALALVAAACGDDDDDTTSTTTAAPTETTAGGGSTTTAAEECTLDNPVKIIALVEKPPESANAIADFDEGLQMAAEEIGDEVCGQPFEYERIPASPTDANAAKNAYLQALDKDPTIVVGLPSSTAVLAVAPEVKNAGIPMIYWSVAPQAFVGGEVGSEWGFLIRPRNTGIAKLMADYTIDDLKAKKIGLLCANLAFGLQGCDAAKAEIEAKGGTVVARETNETTDTDLTAKVIALKNASPDAVIAFTFPNNLVLLYNQAATNGLDVPIFGGSSAGLIVKAVDSAARSNVWGTDDCVPISDSADADWKAKYEEKFGKTMVGSGYAIAEAYDSLLLSVAAIKQAGSTDPKAVADALREIEYEGVCTTYKADPGQGLGHETHVVQFDAQGVAQSKKKVEVAGS
jgi:ABC-type branched-subunit amino acid transport system substrate-binding protein